MESASKDGSPRIAKARALFDEATRAQVLKFEEAQRNHVNESVAWMTQISAELAELNDRAGIIVLGAAVDQLLVDVLKAALRPRARLGKELIESANAPLGTFSSRIRMAEALGWLEQEFATALHGLRRARNEAAHISGPFDFESVAQNIKPLQDFFEGTVHYKNLSSRIDPPEGCSDKLRAWLDFTAAGLSALLLLDQNRLVALELSPGTDYWRHLSVQRKDIL